MDQVPALVDPLGHFWEFDDFHRFDKPDFLPQLEREFRKQIEIVYALGLHPDHLDWHSIRLNKKPGVFDMLLRLAHDFGLPLRTFGRENIRNVQAMGLPCNDYDMLDSYLIEPVGQAKRYTELAGELKPGLNEWAIHPGIADEELMGIDPNSFGIRQRDHDYWTSSEALQTLDAHNVVILDYSALKKFWQFQEEI